MLSYRCDISIDLAPLKAQRTSQKKVKKECKHPRMASMMSFGPGVAVVHTNLQHLWLRKQDLNKIKLVKTLSMDEGGDIKGFIPS